MPQQFENPANPDVHARTTAEELWRDTDGTMDIFVAGVGTGGTLTGVGRLWKERRPALRIVAVEPIHLAGHLGRPARAPHKIQGIGAGFIPANLDTRFIDEVVDGEQRRGVRDGPPPGPRGGHPGRHLLRRGAPTRRSRSPRAPENAGKLVVFVVPSTSERYISTDLFAGME